MTSRKATFEEDVAGGSSVCLRSRGDGCWQREPAGRNCRNACSKKWPNHIQAEATGNHVLWGSLRSDNGQDIDLGDKRPAFYASYSYPTLLPNYITWAVVLTASHFDLCLCKMHFSSLSSHSLFIFKLRNLLNPPKMMTWQETTLGRRL